MISMKKDQYRRARGGTAQMIDVLCSRCGERVLHYQKDGAGHLLRCYLNRIFSPDKWERLQHDMTIHSPDGMPKLVCDCGNLLGVPMRHKDGRLAFRLVRGKFLRKRSAGNDKGAG